MIRSPLGLRRCSLAVALTTFLVSSAVPVGAADSIAQPGHQSIKVAAVDFIPAWGDLEGNIRRLVLAAEVAAAQGVRYAVFPEVATTSQIQPN